MKDKKRLWCTRR